MRAGQVAAIINQIIRTGAWFFQEIPLYGFASPQKVCDNRGFPPKQPCGMGDPILGMTKTRRARTHGFLVRMKTRGGRAVINARRAKGRKRLAA